MVKRRKFLEGIALLGTGSLAGCTGATGGGGEATPTPSPTESGMNFQDGEIDMNVSPSVPQDRLEDQYAPIRDYLSNEFDLPAKMNIAKNYSVVIQALGSGTSDIAETGPFAAALGVKAGMAEIILQRFGYGSWTYKSTVRTRAESDLSDLADLAAMDNPTIAFADKLSTSGTLYPLFQLKKAGMDIGDLPEGNGSNAEFEAVFAGGHTASYETLVNGQADAAGMGGFVKEEGVKMLKVVEGLPRAPIVVSPKLPETTKEAITEAFIDAPDSIYLGQDGDADTDDDLWFGDVRRISVEEYQSVIDVANELGVGAEFFENV